MNILYKFTSVVLASILALSTISVSAIEDENLYSEEAISISSAQELSAINNSSEALAGNYYLTCDIDLAQNDQLPNDPNNNFTTIGSEKTPFTGTFDGRGNEVKNLWISNSDDCQGLFGVVTGTVSNLKISGSVTGGTRVGGVAGYNTGTISECESYVSVSGIERVGGLAGEVGKNGQVYSSTNYGNVSATGSCVGGLFGYVTYYDKNNTGGSATVYRCKNNGEVTSNADYVGGLVGFFDCGEFIDCVNSGKVTGRSAVGGLGGQMRGHIANPPHGSFGQIAIRTSKFKECENYGLIEISDDECKGNLVGVMVKHILGEQVSYLEDCFPSPDYADYAVGKTINVKLY